MAPANSWSQGTWRELSSFNSKQKKKKRGEKEISLFFVSIISSSRQGKERQGFVFFFFQLHILLYDPSVHSFVHSMLLPRQATLDASTNYTRSYHPSSCIVWHGDCWLLRQRQKHSTHNIKRVYDCVDTTRILCSIGIHTYMYEGRFSNLRTFHTYSIYE